MGKVVPSTGFLSLWKLVIGKKSFLRGQIVYLHTFLLLFSFHPRLMEIFLNNFFLQLSCVVLPASARVLADAFCMPSGDYVKKTWIAYALIPSSSKSSGLRRYIWCAEVEKPQKLAKVTQNDHEHAQWGDRYHLKPWEELCIVQS